MVRGGGQRTKRTVYEEASRRRLSDARFLLRHQNPYVISGLLEVIGEMIDEILIKLRNFLAQAINALS